MQIPILNGIYADVNGDFRTSYPRNLIPVPKQQGISSGYLKPANGIALLGVGPGLDRGGINWNGACYRVMGSKLISIDKNGVVSILGDVGTDGKQVSFDYSFDRLGISSNRNLFYWNGTLTRVTDPNLGIVLDFIFIGGYFLTTDGTNLVVTELNNPLIVNPLKYGSSEADPDPIKRVIKNGVEVCAVNRYTIETFDNVGGNFFPFQVNQSALILRGAIGTYAATLFTISGFTGVAFVGSARKEPPSIWFGINGQTTSLSTREIDTILQGYTEAELSQCVIEPKVDKAHNHLYLHLPDQTLVYDAAASLIAKEPVWFVLTTSLVGKGKYRARNFVWCYDKWVVGDTTAPNVGYFVDNISSHFGDINGWDFATAIIYNQGNGCIFHEMELVGLPGHVVINGTPTVWTSYSTDGETWSQERPRTAGRQGKRDTRLNWLQMGNMKNYRIQRFRGTSDAHLSIARLEARIEPLND